MTTSDFTTSGCSCGPDPQRDRVQALANQGMSWADACRAVYPPNSARRETSSMRGYVDDIADSAAAWRKVADLLGRLVTSLGDAMGRTAS